jgi:hypothetical protein
MTSSSGPKDPYPLSSRPKRTRISYYALLAMTTGAVSRKGNRMNLINAAVLDRKSGGAQWRDLCVDALTWKCFQTEPIRKLFRSAPFDPLNQSRRRRFALFANFQMNMQQR